MEREQSAGHLLGTRTQWVCTVSGKGRILLRRETQPKYRGPCRASTSILKSNPIEEQGCWPLRHCERFPLAKYPVQVCAQRAGSYLNLRENEPVMESLKPLIHKYAKIVSVAPQRISQDISSSVEFGWKGRGWERKRKRERERGRRGRRMRETVTIAKKAKLDSFIT